MRKVAWVRRAAPLIVAAALCGCVQVDVGGKGGDPNATTYTLHPPEATAAVARGESGVIVVPKPDVPPGFDGDQIVLFLGAAHRQDHYAGAKWSAKLDELLQDFIVRTARAELPGRVVQTPDAEVKARYRLNVKISDFEPVYADKPDTPPKLVVAMTMTVVALPGERARAAATVTKSAMASENRLSVVTKELDALLLETTQEALRKVAPDLR
jgi:ABC-type uncharacterized transport system auxiliary subunit